MAARGFSKLLIIKGIAGRGLGKDFSMGVRRLESVWKVSEEGAGEGAGEGAELERASPLPEYTTSGSYSSDRHGELVRWALRADRLLPALYGNGCPIMNPALF